MKILKFILKLIVLLALVFFLTGLFIKKVDYSVEIEANKPLEGTFSLFNDHTIMDQWIKDVKSFTPIEETEGMVGNKYRMVVEDQGREIEMIETITAWEPNQRVGMAFKADEMHKVNDIHFTNQGNTTIITNNASCRGTSYIAKCMFPYFKSMFRNIDQEMLDDFKSLTERI